MRLITLTCQNCHFTVQTTGELADFEDALTQAGWILEPDTRTVICATCVRIAVLENKAQHCEECFTS